MQGLIRVTEEGGESASPLSSSGAPNAGQLAGWGATSRGIGKMGLRSCIFYLGLALYCCGGKLLLRWFRQRRGWAMGVPNMGAQFWAIPKTFWDILKASSFFKIQS